jgi:hypothetical protein
MARGDPVAVRCLVPLAFVLSFLQDKLRDATLQKTLYIMSVFPRHRDLHLIKALLVATQYNHFPSCCTAIEVRETNNNTRTRVYRISDPSSIRTTCTTRSKAIRVGDKCCGTHGLVSSPQGLPQGQVPQRQVQKHLSPKCPPPPCQRGRIHGRGT